MATVLYEYFRIQNKYFQIPITASNDTRVECDNVGMVTNNGDDYPGIFCFGAEWNNSTISICGGFQSAGERWLRRFGNSYTDFGQTSIVLTLGQKYNMSLDKTKFVIDSTEYSVNATSFTPNNMPMIIGGRYNGTSSNVNRIMDGYVGDFRIYDDNVLVMELKPAVNNGQHCYYDTVGDAYYYPQGSGTVEAFNPLHIFSPSQSKLSFQSIQSSQNITITAETGWTATTNNSWISLSQNTGSSGETNVTVTVADGSNEGSRVGKITFTDDEDYTFDVDVYQLKLGMKVYVNRYKVGSTNIVKQQRGVDNVKKMYMGNDLVYQKFAFSPKLSISVDSMEFKCSGDTAQSVTVNSNTNWNYTTDVNWLTLTKDGNTLSVLPDDYTSELENRTATITITADNGDIVKTKTISVTQKKATVYEEVDWVHTRTYSGNYNDYISTDITATTNTSVRVVMRGAGINYTDRVVGYWSENGGTDSNDWRLFAYQGCTLDMNNFRQSNSSYDLRSENVVRDFTVGNCYVYDNIGEQYIINNGSFQSLSRPNVINVDVTAQAIKSVQIYEGETLVFDGVAAVYEGHIGLYDRVSDTLKYNGNLDMVYE